MQTVMKHNDTLTDDALSVLLETQAPNTISIYMPTVRAGDQVQQNPIRYKNLVRRLEDMLRARDEMEASERNALIDRLEELYEPPNRFWEFQSDGLAIFISGDMFETYRVPLDFEEIIEIGDRFFITPLIPLLSEQAEFYVLALSQDNVRFLHGTRAYVEEIDLPDMPKSYDEALRFDVENQSIQHHTTTKGPNEPAFHGQGIGGDEAVRKDKIKQFLQQVDQHIYDYLDAQRAPLILAGVEYECVMYRDLSKYQYILPDFIDGSPKMLSEEELHQQAWDILSNYFGARLENLQNLWAQYNGNHDDRAASGIEELVLNAFGGRVDTLMCPSGFRARGTFDPETTDISVTGDENDTELLNIAVIHTLFNSGAVINTEANTQPKAVLRY